MFSTILLACQVPRSGAELLRLEDDDSFMLKPKHSAFYSTLSTCCADRSHRVGRASRDLTTECAAAGTRLHALGMAHLMRTRWEATPSRQRGVLQQVWERIPLSGATAVGDGLRPRQRRQRRDRLAFACDLAKGTRCEGARPFRVVPLTDNVPLITAWVNDAGYERVFVEQLAALVQPGDLVVAVSASGHSPNVAAADLAREADATTIALTGRRGGRLYRRVDLAIRVPAGPIEQVEDAHLAMAHSLCVALRAALRAEAGSALPEPGPARAKGGKAVVAVRAS